MFGELVGGEGPDRGCPEQNWRMCLKDGFQAFGAMHGPTDEDRRTFGVPRAVWTAAAKEEEGGARVLWGADMFMTPCHKDEEGLADNGRSSEINNEPSNSIRHQPTGAGAEEDLNCGRRIQERGGGPSSAIRAGLST